jgi:hypothetical protein
MKIYRYIIFWLVLQFPHVSVFSQEVSEAVKLEIFCNNHIQEYGDERRDDVLKYFIFLMAKDPDNDELQEILGNLVYTYWSELSWEVEKVEKKEEEIVLTNKPELWEYPGATARLVTEWVFDEDAVEQAWIGWVNDEIRIPRWLDPVQPEWRLRETARDRSISLRDKWVADHKRYSHSW